MVFVSVCYCVLWPQSHLVFWTVFGWLLLLYGQPFVFQDVGCIFAPCSSLIGRQQVKTSKGGQENSEMLTKCRGSHRFLRVVSMVSVCFGMCVASVSPSPLDHFRVKSVAMEWPETEGLQKTDERMGCKFLTQ